MDLTKVGRYEIREELGRGAMGVVYRGFDPTIGRTVAIKTISLETADADLVKRFRREAQAAGILSHPNIVTIYDAGEDRGVFYIAMELVEGETLQQMLERGSLPLAKVISITEQVGAALDYAHAREIIHRDIKPANIMVSGNLAKVMDFGVAKITSQGMTTTGQVLGTPSYMSPELVKGTAIDGRSDIFSLGVVLYELLAGARPFTADNVTTLIYKIVGEPPAVPSVVNPQLPPGLNYVLLKTLAKNPAERYQNCAELTADLKNHPALAEKGREAAEGAQAAAPGDLGRTVVLKVGPEALPPRAEGPAPVRRRKLLWAVSAAAALAVTAGIIWQTHRTSSPSDSTPETTTPPPAVHRPPESRKAPRPAPATPGQAGRIVVLTEPPSATILVNGKATAYHSPVNFALPAGKYKITVEKRGFESETWDAVVRKNQTARFDLALRPTGTPRRGPLFH